MKILVLGSTGVLGRHVVPRLLERGHGVRAMVRRAEQARVLDLMGAETVLGDIFDLGSLERAVQACSVVLHLATAIPRDGNQDWGRNDRIRREGTRNLLAAASGNGVRRYVQQSITLVYGDQGRKVVDESAAFQDLPLNASSLDMEAAVRASDLEWTILRGGIFYGPGTGRDEGWRTLAHEGKLRVPGDGGDLVSLVHVVDYARAVVAAVERAPALGIFNIVDDEPVSFGHLFGHFAAHSGAEPLKAGAEKFLPSLGCANRLAREILNWKPVFPTYRSGLA